MKESSSHSVILRQALLEHCRLAGWTPRHIGEVDSDPGLEEALLEIIATREAEASRLSLELIDICERLGWQSPWLLDNRARGFVHLGRDPEALAIWNQLSGHTDPAVASTAESTISDLQARPAAAVLANRIRQLRERNEPERWKPLLLEALLNSHVPMAQELATLIEDLASEQPTPPGCTWDSELLKQELTLQLFEEQLPRWEARLR